MPWEHQSDACISGEHVASSLPAKDNYPHRLGLTCCTMKIYVEIVNRLFSLFLCNSIFLVQFNNFVVMYHCCLLLFRGKLYRRFNFLVFNGNFPGTQTSFFSLLLVKCIHVKAVLFSLYKEKRWKYASICEYTTQSVCSVIIIFTENHCLLNFPPCYGSNAVFVKVTFVSRGSFIYSTHEVIVYWVLRSPNVKIFNAMY